MSTNRLAQIELLKLNVSLIEKTNFMLLTATTASIAYVLTQLKGLIWTNLIYIPMASLLLLALSFLFGCNALNNMAKVLKTNSLALKANQPHDIVAITFSEVERLIKRAHLFDVLQQLTFCLGALIYAVYIFLNIYLKTKV